MSKNIQSKTYILENLGCANCAAKMEHKIQELPDVESASIIFATKQLRIQAADPDSLKDKVQHICHSIEREVIVVDRNDPSGSEVSSNDNLHKAKSSLFSDHKSDIITLVIGMILFASGAVIEHIWGYDMWFAAGGSIVILKFAFFVCAYILLGYKVLLTAFKNILHGQIFDENFLMSLATIAAFCIGELAEGVGVMLFYRIGQIFEDIAVERSRSQIMDAVDMRPETVVLISEHNEPRIIPAENATPGDILLVRPGDRIPLDGIVTEGESMVDTSPITGEPVPVSIHPGDEVVSGSINEQGVLKIRVIKPLSESMVTRILNSVENAAAGKPKIDRFITRFARVYTPIVVVLALLTAIVPSIITGDWTVWVKASVTFLVISCPCALVISVPLAFFSGIGAASKLGILFKGGLAIEALKYIKAIVMDKTGTITKGVFEVNNISVFDGLSESEVLAIAAACESSSSHPIAASILKRYHQSHDNNHEHCGCDNHGTTPTALSIEEIAGMGIKAQLAEGTALCGNRKLMNMFGIKLPEIREMSGTEVLVALDCKLIGCITISDQLKDDSISAISRLKSMGLIPAMLTGDNMQSATAVASASGISDIHAELLPDEKLVALKGLHDRYGSVMFVGDGINDAPVLAGADVGAAMGSGADAAIEAADVVFMTSSLEAVPQSLEIAHYTRRIAMQNIILALTIKLLVILLGFIGFANIWAAVLADTGVAMLCILNSLRVLWRKYL